MDKEAALKNLFDKARVIAQRERNLLLGERTAFVDQRGQSCTAEDEFRHYVGGIARRLLAQEEQRRSMREEAEFFRRVTQNAEGCQEGITRFDGICVHLKQIGGQSSIPDLLQEGKDSLNGLLEAIQELQRAMGIRPSKGEEHAPYL